MINVACVGDSITAGYLSSNSSMAYPGRLQSILDDKYGTGIYHVTNLGAGGATLQKEADSPYWNRTQYAQFLNGTWDVVLIMLGTNDAKDKSTGGSFTNWHENCSSLDATTDTCVFLRDYQSLIDVARVHGAGGKKPLVAVAVPPPLMRDAAYGMNQTVLNDFMPSLVSKAATHASLPAPIDVYSAFGGNAKWRKNFPSCGCELEQDMTNARSHQQSVPGNFTSAQGFLASGNNVEVGNYTFEEAIALCAGASNCSGFTFEGNSSQPSSKTRMRLKRCNTGVVNSKTWWSWLKPKPATPPAMPSNCALFCDDTSCDQCHPDDDGYFLLAKTVAAFVMAHHGTAETG
jgi:lysophospholipase L1-like esterase